MSRYNIKNSQGGYIPIEDEDLYYKVETGTNLPQIQVITPQTNYRDETTYRVIKQGYLTATYNEYAISTGDLRQLHIKRLWDAVRSFNRDYYGIDAFVVVSDSSNISYNTTHMTHYDKDRSFIYAEIYNNNNRVNQKRLISSNIYRGNYICYGSRYNFDNSKGVHEQMLKGFNDFFSLNANSDLARSIRFNVRGLDFYDELIEERAHELDVTTEYLKDGVDRVQNSNYNSGTVFFQAIYTCALLNIDLANLYEFQDD